MKRKSFTLIELIVVIAIVAILATVIATVAMRAIDKAKSVRMATDFKAIKSACLNYRGDIGRWPALGMINQNHPLLYNDGSIFGWNGPYLETPAKAPVATRYDAPGCAPPGFYFLGTTMGNGGWCCDEAYGYFDLDGNGTYEVFTGLSANAYGVYDIPVRRGVNRAIDGVDTDDDRTGLLKVSSGPVFGTCPGFLFYYVGSF